MQDLNLRLPPCKGGALPAELIARGVPIFVPEDRFVYRPKEARNRRGACHVRSFFTYGGLMRRLPATMVVLSFAGATLAACGDTGDHFGDFHQTVYPTLVSSFALAMPIVPGKGPSGKFTLYVTAYSGGVAIAQGTQLQNPIVINSNAPGIVGFGGKNGPFTNSRSYASAPGPITVNYRRLANPCTPYVGITGFNHDAQPQVETLTLTPQCPGAP